MADPNKPPTMSDAQWAAFQKKAQNNAVLEKANKYDAEYKPTQESFLLGGDDKFAGNFRNEVNTAGRNVAFDQNTIGREARQGADAARAEAATARGRVNPAAGQIAQSAATGNQQGGLASKLTDFAERPEGPSAAQAQLQKGTNQALSSQIALARSGGGLGENAAMMGQAGRNAAGIQAAGANDAATLRANEYARSQDRRLQAYDAAGGVLGQQRQGTMAEAGAELDAQGQRDQTALGYAAEERAGRGLASDTSQRAGDASLAASDLGLKAEGLATTGRTAYEQAQEESYLNRMGFDKQRRDERQARKDKKTDTILGVMSGVGGWLKGSDIRGKQNIATLPGGRPAMPRPAMGGGLAARAAQIGQPTAARSMFGGGGRPPMAQASPGNASQYGRKLGGGGQTKPGVAAGAAARMGAMMSDPKTKTKVRNMDSSPENEGYDPTEDEGYKPTLKYLRKQELEGKLAPGSADFGSADANKNDRTSSSSPKLYRFIGSDKDTKKEIDTPDKKGSEYLGVGKYEFEYKDPEKHGAGRYRGPMAHELRGIPGIVHETPDGEAVDAGRLSMSNASELGELRREMELLKKERRA